METRKTIYQLHEEHKTWLNKLLFYKDELSIMTNRLSEIAKKNTSTEVLSLVDHFHNQLVIQKEQIDILHHNINSHESYLETAVRKSGNDLEQVKFSDHKIHRESIAVFEKIFKELREELIDFLSKWM
jgi:hypothetical protein